MPEDRTMTDFDHRLWPDRAFLGNPCAGSSCQNNNFHNHAPIFLCLTNVVKGKLDATPFATREIQKTKDLQRSNQRQRVADLLTYRHPGRCAVGSSRFGRRDLRELRPVSHPRPLTRPAIRGRAVAPQFSAPPDICAESW